MERMRELIPTGAAPRYARLFGVCAALVALLSVLVSASSAALNEHLIMTVQRAFVDEARGGGAVLTPPLLRLVPVWVATYLSLVLVFLIALGFAAYAGYVAYGERADARWGAEAGHMVMFVMVACWSIALLLFSVVFQLDGTFSWLVGLLAATGTGTPASGTIYTQGPTPIYLFVQVVMVLVHVLFFGVLGAWLGGVAGRRGALFAARQHERSARAAPQESELSPQ